MNDQTSVSTFTFLSLCLWNGNDQLKLLFFTESMYTDDFFTLSQPHCGNNKAALCC